MSDTFNAPKDISKMDFKELRAEVQLLWDEMARMKRGYEDAIYNLDYDNFSSRVMKDQKGMQTSIEQTAEKITLQAEAVNEKFKSYSTIEQTAERINLSVETSKQYTETYVTNALTEGEYVTNATFKSQFDVYADGIYAEVSETREYVDSYYNDLSYDINTINSSISSIKQTANTISTRVEEVASGTYTQDGTKYTLFEQTADKFTFVGNVDIEGGTLAGSAIQNSQRTRTLLMKDSVGGVGDYGTFCLYNKDYGNVPYFSVYDDATGGKINLYSAGKVFLHIEASGANDNGLLVQPKGTWDFSQCQEVTGLESVLEGGYAVFG